MSQDLLQQLNRHLVPQPRRLQITGSGCRVSLPLKTEFASACGEEDRFAAGVLERALAQDFAGVAGTGKSTMLRFARDSQLPAEGYRLSVTSDVIAVESSDPAGAYYATQTLRQWCARQGGEIIAPCVKIEDWPALKYRAIHYDTKHHQPTEQYVLDFIEELAHYKVNVLVWEWEDKFAYRSHPEIGAPGAFTLEQMQRFTRHARQHHVQLVPLVQGLGHVSYILKHPQHAHLREIADSNWEFCPLKEGTYPLLFDLWREAIESTPGSELLHIGSDETYELGQGEACGCKQKMSQIGKDGLMQIFIRRCAEFVEGQGRRMISWGGEWRPGNQHQPPTSMVIVDHSDLDYLRQAKAAGYKAWIYAPNPGIMSLFLPHFPTVVYSRWQSSERFEHRGVFRQAADPIAAAAREQVVEGSITTSWDDAGLHDRMWMYRFITAAEFSWNDEPRDMDAWARTFFGNYFGPEARDLRELFQLLQECVNFFDDTLERRVWHWGDIGKMHLPDFPRGDLEISNFWRRRYAELLPLARRQRQDLARALAIIDDNLAHPVKHAYDLQLMRSCATLMDHNAALVLMLAELEHQICLASEAHYRDRKQAPQHLRNAEKLVADHLSARQRIFADLVALWEQTRLPKGLSLPGKPYVFARDRARHFANRVPDMSYLILDEQKLDLEGYLDRLTRYTAEYEAMNRLA